ncbi:LLM class flavin-dependent oxidoreductase [Actinoplanes derwentensis]|uniref:Flavin-dependent oxidoreductase, luciferase family (Includes alkanesulfonate monooxygenase SsuD and methylene tetrahydromethanopterin reductase) n=1 Tax=Actinoplanes derwentensis TaxID=113562 RepID=A0A1H1YIJ8_9ACTN|nr:LLM class flavin-dependent oxidoreductase [Actinoplanes derwentensis]GID81146.1 alkanal monooxygenase [Actinoplanes derwentensis]SDT20856.1 Flavin-dependent oxidoreductase, luciferase family (includes alkanesulfonate monooxygenase SsuD and methylene tetrahydromethanopterin reductase) [Actinoplanes derwentensis]
MHKKIGFLSFGHWRDVAGSQTRSASDALLQTIELAVAAEELGIDSANVRVHHFERQLAAPFPLLAAIGARTSRIEMGTGVVDMRYENPLYMAEEAAATDLISGGRLQLGVSRGSPETALRGAESFGYVPADGETVADHARQKIEIFLAAIDGKPVARTDPARTGGVSGGLAIQPQAPGLRQRIWWGAGTRVTAEWAGRIGMNLQSSTLLTEDTGVPFDQLQAEQIALYRQAFKDAGHAWEPRVSVSRSVLPITEEIDRIYFGREGDQDQVGLLEGVRSRFGRTYSGDPDRIADELAADEAVLAADTVLLTVPNQLGVQYNTRLLETIAKHVAPAIGWSPAVTPR